MSETLRISQTNFTSGSPEERATGLLGWISLIYGDLLLDGLTLRRTRAGALTIAFPKPTRRSGLARNPVRPVGAAARQRIEAQVIAALRRQGAIP